MGGERGLWARCWAGFGAGSLGGGEEGSPAGGFYAEAEGEAGFAVVLAGEIGVAAGGPGEGSGGSFHEGKSSAGGLNWGIG